MSLDNLVKIGKLHPHEARRDEIQRLLRGLERSLADARVEALSNEGRLAAAYDSVLRLATIELRAANLTHSAANEIWLLTKETIRYRIATWPSCLRSSMSSNPGFWLGCASSTRI